MPLTLAQQPDDTLKRLVQLGILAAGMPLESIPDGSINTVWRVRTAGGEPAVLRVGPSRAEVAAGPSWMRAEALACEAIVLDRVRPEITVVPVPVAAGFRDRDHPWLVQTTVPGRPLSTILPEMTAAERAAVWGQVGVQARRLHAVTAPWFGTPDGRHRFVDWADMIRADAVGLRDDAERFGIDVVPFDRLLSEIDEHAGVLRAVTTPAVVHSDLDPRHIFVEPGADGWEISGLIDWEYARFVDPLSESLMVDLLARAEDDPDRTAFLAGYGLDADLLRDPAFRQRQRIYRGIAEGWALTDAARLRSRDS